MKQQTKPETSLDENTIVITKQPDGNYIGEMIKHGKQIQERQGDPYSVLQALLTHE